MAVYKDKNTNVVEDKLKGFDLCWCGGENSSLMSNKILALANKQSQSWFQILLP